MRDFVSLQQLLLTGRASSWPVAFGAAGAVNFADFRRDVWHWQQAFQALPGSRVALHFSDSYQFATALFGLWHAGKCAVLPGDDLPATVTRLTRLVEAWAGDGVGPIGLPHVDIAAVADGIDPVFAFEALDLSAMQLQIFTSGSTGEPVAIEKRLGQLFAEVENLHQQFALDSAQVQATVSHQHIYGLLFRVLWPLAAGRALGRDRLVYPEVIAEQLALGPKTILISSPAHLKRLPMHAAWPRAAEQLTAIFSSGGPLPEAGVSLCLSLFGQAPIEIYGSSETGGIGWRQRRNLNEAGWMALTGVEWQIKDQQLHIKSAHLPDALWHVGPDRVEAEQGGFVLLGRQDRIAKIEEKRVSLTALEASLLAGGLVQEVRVIERGDTRRGLAVVAVPSAEAWAIIDSAGKRALNQRLTQQLANAVEHVVLPRQWRYVTELPCNAQGKLTQEALAALFDPKRPEARVLERGPHHARLAITAQAESPYFDGHFPSTPILPGVAQLEWAIRFARELFVLPADFLRMDNLKFQQVIGPELAIELSLKVEPATSEPDGSCGLRFSIQSAAGQHASGRLIFGSRFGARP